jgi:rare lipoprotein A
MIRLFALSCLGGLAVVAYAAWWLVFIPSAYAGDACGTASWYGPGFHGRTTASGETYNQNAMTAAHPTMQFGTKVRVVNQKTGKSVMVRINDRGPYHGGRIIDLSKGAAAKLGMINSGTAKVCLTRI